MITDKISIEWILYIMLYGGAAVAALIACIYLVLRRGNAFAPGLTPPVRLRRRTAAFFAVSCLGHIWWVLFDLYSGNVYSVFCVVVATIDSMSLLATLVGMQLSMLQDHKRKVWPVVMAGVPYPVFLALNVVYPGRNLINIGIAYILLMYVLFTVYMVFAVRKYGRWLRDNYADLEHKEVWISQLLVGAILILTIVYGFDTGDLTIAYVVQLIETALFGLLLWRVETLPNLQEEQSAPLVYREVQRDGANIEQLLAELCVAKQLYLQHDLTLHQLAHAIGTNRTYLSQYFSCQGITYNTYINNLRIDYFMDHYCKVQDDQHPITVRRLASESGYNSYSTFSLAFKQRVGESVTIWMRKMSK